MIFRFSPILLLLLWAINVPAHVMMEQECISDHCIQIGINKNEVNAQDSFLQIYINDGLVKIIGDPKDQIKINNLQSQITQYLKIITQREERNISDREALTHAEQYIKSLLKRLSELENNIAQFNTQGKLIQQIIEAKAQFNVPLLKTLLKEKLQLDDENAAETTFELARLQELDLEYAEAYHNYQKAVYLRKHSSKYLNAVGEMALTLAKLEDALQYIEKALLIDIKESGENHLDVARDYNNLGGYWGERKNYDKAALYYTKALNIYINNLGEHHPEVAARYGNLGLTWHAKEDYDKAIFYHNKSLEINIHSFGSTSTEVARDYNSLGGVYQSKGQYDLAISYYKKALEIAAKNLGQKYPHVAAVHNNLGTAWLEKENYDEAIDSFEKALEIHLKTFGYTHPKVAIFYSQLGTAWLYKGDNNKAIYYLEHALDILQNLKGNNSTIAIVLNNLGKAWYTKNQYNKAFDYFNQALNILQETLGPEHPSTKIAVSNIKKLKESMK